MQSLGFFIAFLALALNAHAVSRVGGGKIQSSFSNFEIQSAAEFADFKSYKDDSVLAMGPMIYQVGKGPVRLFIELSEFISELPDKVNASQISFAQEMLTAGWKIIPQKEHCVVLLESTTADTLAYVGAWGSGKGFVLKGIRSADTAKAMKEMLATLRIQPGSCAWK